MSEASDRAIARTVRQIDDLQAAIARVRALAERWRASGNASYMTYGDDVLDALDGQP